MYNVDEKDRVVKITDIPQSSIGAPCPFILSDESKLLLTYYLEIIDPDWDGSNVKEIGMVTDGEPIAVVQFEMYKAYSFGPPNDEAFEGHPLASRGLSAYGVFQVENSTWIRQLENMNSGHPQHDPKKYKELKHYIFSFHDNTFECICKDFTVNVRLGSIKNIVKSLLESY